MLFLVIFLLYSKVSLALQSESIIRDEESEIFIKQLAEPLYKVTQIKPLKNYIIANNEINCFVKGNAIFINSRLISLAFNSNVLYTALAHEVGHIKNYHNLSQIETNFLPLILFQAFRIGQEDTNAENLSISSINSLHKSDSNERDADTVAIEIIERTNRNLDAFYNLLYFLQKDNTQYIKIHPINNERMLRIKKATMLSRDVYRINSINIEDSFMRVSSKLEGYFSHNRVLTEKNDIFSSPIRLPNYISQERLIGNNIEMQSSLAFDRRLEKNRNFYNNYRQIFAKIASKDFIGAREILVMLLGDKENDVYLLEALADVEFNLGNIQVAISTLEKAISNKRGNSKKIFLIEMKKISYIIELYKQIAKTDENDIKLQKLREKLRIELEQTIPFAIESEKENGQYLLIASKVHEVLGNLSIAKLYEAEERILLDDCKQAYKLAILSEDIYKKTEKSFDRMKFNNIINKCSSI
jgi:predicted Zn-dependent protease